MEAEGVGTMRSSPKYYSKYSDPFEGIFYGQKYVGVEEDDPAMLFTM
jgi:hypothetical protein